MIKAEGHDTINPSNNKERIMNTKMISKFLTIATVGLFVLSTGCATKKTEAAAEAPAPVVSEAAKAPAAETAMPAKMDMNQMMDMKHQCMSEKHSAKKCGHDMMAKCQQTMDKKECKKMMKEMKKSKTNK